MPSPPLRLQAGRCSRILARSPRVSRSPVDKIPLPAEHLHTPVAIVDSLMDLVGATSALQLRKIPSPGGAASSRPEM